MYKNTPVYIFLIGIVCSVNLYAQDDCTFTLSRAQRLFDAGNIEQIPSLLNPCIESGFTKEEKQQAQKLIILSYLFDKNTTDAEKSMLEFLRKYPEYQLGASDQAEFVQLFETFRTLPIASLGVIGGANYSQISKVKIYDPKNAVGEYKSSTPGFQAGLSFKLYLIDKLDINLEALYIQTNHEYYNENNPGGIVTLSETQTNVAFPLSIIYTPFTFDKISLFIRAGLNTRYMLSANMQTERISGASSKPIAIPEFSILKGRNPLQFQLLGAIGLTYTLKQSYVLLELRYNRGLMMLTTKEKYLEAENQDLWSVNQVGENDIVMHNLTFNIGLFYKFYKPRKR